MHAADVREHRRVRRRRIARRFSCARRVLRVTAGGVYDTTFGLYIVLTQRAITAVAIDPVAGTIWLAGQETDGSDGGYQHERKVYARTDEPCSVCGTQIKRIVLGARSSHYCPRCQK